MTTDTKRLTLDEIALLREVFRWARNHDVTPAGMWGGAWREGLHGKMVSYSDDMIGWAPSLYTAFHWLAVDSVTQAIDVLVAVGHLPQRFSSAYLAGWNALAVWRSTDRSDRAEFRRLFHDPENISFPVGEYR